MSWLTDRAAIVSALPSGYVLIPENNEPENAPLSHNHKAYSLRLRMPTDIELLSSDVMHYSHLVRMRVIYRAVDSTQLIANEGLMMTLIQTISNISGFHSFESIPEIVDKDNKHTILELNFHFGLDDNE